MKFLDRIALNRLVSILTSFILALLKIIVPKDNKTIDIPKPKIDKPFWKPRRRKKDE